MWLLISPEGKFFISRGWPVFNAKPWKFSFVQCFSLYLIKLESHLCALIWKDKSSCLFFQEFPNVLKVMQLKTVAEVSLYSAASGYLLCRVWEKESVWGVSSPVVSVLDSGSDGPGSSPGWGMTLCP